MLPNMDVPKAPKDRDPWKGYEKLSYTIKVVTPIMGGGAEANRAEECFAVRPSEIRGHLRFWWRELFAKDLKGEALRKVETAIWGDSQNPSNVVVQVEGGAFTAKRMKSQDFFGFRRYSKESYALFPLESDEDPRCSLVKEGGNFTCHVLMKESVLNEEQRLQVKKAVNVWILLGGIGARTRRGLGCLQCDVTDVSVLNDMSVYAGSNCLDAMAAWATGLDLYKKFRQQRRPGQEPNRPGRSYWPEAESCRKATEQRLPKHASLGNQLDGNGAVDDEFTSPKAALGMPIIIHFKDNRPCQDPDDLMINVGGKEGRMGSPVIIKPLFVNGSWSPAYIFLKNTAQDILGLLPGFVGVFRGKNNLKEVKIVRENAIPSKLDVRENSDAIIALKQYVEKFGYKKLGGAK